MKLKLIFGAAFTLLGLAVGFGGYAEARFYEARFPSVAQLQFALNARPGAQIPAKEVEANGKYWTAWYVGAHAIGGGRYSIIIQLR